MKDGNKKTGNIYFIISYQNYKVKKKEK